VCVVVAACASSKGNNIPPGDGQTACEPDGTHRCNGSSYEVCSGGIFVAESECVTGCVDALGCVDCPPGQTFCMDGDVYQCDDTGHPGSLVQACTGVQVCNAGGCTDACADAANSKSYIGCEYYAIDLDNAVEVEVATSSASTCSTLVPGGVIRNLPVCAKVQGINVTLAGLCDPPATMGGAATCPSGFTCGARDVCVLDAQSSPFAIVVSNPQARDVNVTVTGPGGQTIQKVVAAGAVASILPQQGNAIPDQSVDGTVKAKRAYRVTSDLPIVAYQFNPLDNVDVFSNDGSLLIPRTAFDTDYYAMTFPTLDRRATAPGKNPYYGYLTVIAWQDGTQIAVTPTTAVTASATQAPIAAGATANFTLNAFEVLQLEALPGVAPAGDLTGTHVVSTNAMSFGVFAGHEATAFGESTAPDATHTNGPCCADHLEEMMFPSTTWGKEFAIARSEPRTNESDLVRVMAQKAGTTVTFTPAPASGACGTLGPGQFCEVKIAADTEISATEPVLIGHFLESSIWLSGGLFPTAIGNGDPSMAIAVPTEQYRTDYTVLVPAQYQQSFLSISATATGGVTVDGQAVTMTPFGTHRGVRVSVAAGQHTIHCADTCGVLVYGYSDAVSYMFAGGLDLKPIVVL